MNFSQINTYLQGKQTTPEIKSPAYEKWIDFTDDLEFLVCSSTQHIPIYISKGPFFLYSVFVSRRKLTGNYVNNLLKWNMSVSAGWGYGYGFDQETKKPEAFIFPPLNSTGSSILDEGEALVFLRSLYHNGDTYLELNQRLAHILDIHKVDHRNAYCKVDEQTGDLVDVISFSQDDDIVCTIDKKSLDFYMFLTDTVLVQLFDVTRWKSGSFNGWQQQREEAIYRDSRNGLYARRFHNIDHDGFKEAGYLRGFHIIRRQRSDKQIISELTGENRKKKTYAKFIAIDWKHNKVSKCSCDPEKLGNYFVESDLPYGISPAFFRPEVMSKYKQDTDKYEISSDNIDCRGAWSLRYRMNDAGQIQVYLIDLGHLPSNEQLYWQSFNEQPKAGVADHVIKRDFYGSWDLPSDPLEKLKQLLKDFPSAHYHGEKVTIMRHPTEKQLAKLTYVLTDSPKEWADQILELAKVLGDGLSKVELRKVAKYHKCDDSQAGSITLLKKCLEAKGVEAEDMQVIVQPLQTLYGLRSSGGIAHAGKSAPNEDLKLHYRKLVEASKEAIERLAELIYAGYLDVPER